MRGPLSVDTRSSMLLIVIILGEMSRVGTDADPHIAVFVLSRACCSLATGLTFDAAGSLACLFSRLVESVSYLSIGQYLEGTSFGLEQLLVLSLVAACARTTRRGMRFSYYSNKDHLFPSCFTLKSARRSIGLSWWTLSSLISADV